MPYPPIEHTADVGLEVTAESLPELFSDALRGMTDVITDVGRVGPVLEHEVELRAGTLDLLLQEFLGEALYQFEVAQELFRAALVEIVDSASGCSLAGKMIGEPFDPARHLTKVALKAVTYHQLEVERDGARWRARVIFDI